MKVELLTTRADRQRRYEIGDVLDLPDAEAIALIESQQAKPVRSQQPELAIAPSGEQTSGRRPGRSTHRR